MEWKAKSIIHKSGLGDKKNWCVKNRVGASMSHSDLTDLVTETDVSRNELGQYVSFRTWIWGPWNPLKKKLHTNVLELRQFILQFNYWPNTNRTFILHQIGQHKSCFIFEQNKGEGADQSYHYKQQSRYVLTVYKQNMITAEHLPGIQNVQADLEIRQIRDTSNRIVPIMFQTYFHTFGWVLVS